MPRGCRKEGHLCRVFNGVEQSTEWGKIFVGNPNSIAHRTLVKAWRASCVGSDMMYDRNLRGIFNLISSIDKSISQVQPFVIEEELLRVASNREHCVASHRALAFENEVGFECSRGMCDRTWI